MNFHPAQSSGVNRLALGCDLLVTEGFIEPHFFAGFSGGRKSILPGICNAATVNENHSYKAISSPFSTTGVLEHNPIHEDMVCAARAVNVQFILNVALNAEKQVIAAFAGDLEQAHEKGVSFVRSLAQCPLPPPAISSSPQTAATRWIRIFIRVRRLWQPLKRAAGRAESSSCVPPASTVWAEPILRS